MTNIDKNAICKVTENFTFRIHRDEIKFYVIYFACCSSLKGKVFKKRKVPTSLQGICKIIYIFKTYFKYSASWKQFIRRSSIVINIKIYQHSFPPPVNTKSLLSSFKHFKERQLNCKTPSFSLKNTFILQNRGGINEGFN